MNEVRTNRQGFSEVKCFELTLERLRDGELLIDSGMRFRTLAAVTLNAWFPIWLVQWVLKGCPCPQRSRYGPRRLYPLTMTIYADVCLSVTSWHFVETGEYSQLVFGTQATLGFTLDYVRVISWCSLPTRVDERQRAKFTFWRGRDQCREWLLQRTPPPWR